MISMIPFFSETENEKEVRFVMKCKRDNYSVQLT